LQIPRRKKWRHSNDYLGVRYHFVAKLL